METDSADERYAPLLRTLPDEEAAEDTLDWDTKRALVLESRADLVAAERGLREIDVYNKRGVAGAENLEGECAAGENGEAGIQRTRTRTNVYRHCGAQTRARKGGCARRCAPQGSGANTRGRCGFGGAV
jgi:hypothetical protein